MENHKTGGHSFYVRQKILLVMKMTSVFVLATFLSASAAVFAQKVSIRVEKANLKEVFKEIRRQTGYTFVYNEQLVTKAGAVSLNIVSDDIRDVLDKCLEGLALGYYIEEDVVVIKSANVLAETVKVRVVKGIVVDKTGIPLPGVTILVKGTGIGAATDVEGKFAIEIPLTAGTMLEFSFVGMKKKEVKLSDKPAETENMKVILEEDEKELDEVVVTGIFNRNKEGFTGSAVTVKGEELKKISTTNIAKALSTIDPSFRIMDDLVNGSDPNRLPDMRMRGQATLPSGGTDNSLVSLQGEYDTYPNQPLLMLDGFEIDVQTMVDLDPDRIASITILKDAAATAIYGSKAANGVIVIETLTPREGEIHVTYGGNVRIEAPDLSDYNLMNAEEKLEAEWKAGIYPGNDLPSQLDYQSRLRAMKRGVDTYWLAQPLRTAVQQRHTLTLEGGSEALRYKLYVGLNNTPGVMKDSKRNTQTGTLDISYRVKKWLLKNSITVDNSLGDNSPYGSFREYTLLNPYLPPYDEHGKVQRVMQLWNMIYTGNIATEPVSNPMYNATFHTLNRTTNFSVRNLFKLEYNPWDFFKFQADISLLKGVGKREVFRPAEHTAFVNVTDPTLKGDFNRVQSENLNYSVDLTASFNKVFGEIHYVTANARLSVQEEHSESYGAKVTGFPNDNMDHILFGKKYDENMSGSESTTRAIGVVGTFGYSYDYRYSVDFNIRVDGSSQFGSNNRFAPFWSTGIRWNIKKENFMQQVSFIDDLVIRGSYGITGTQGFPAYQAQQVYTYNNLMVPYLASDATGTELVALGNSNLKWQQTDTWNVALEIGVLDRRITARAEYFQKITKNSLAQISLAPSVGFASYPENMGTIENKGIELNFSFIPYRNIAQQAYWVITFNGSHNVDRITKISEALRHMNELNNNKQGAVPLPHYEEGQSLNRIWVMKSLGIDPATGDELFVKRDGSVTSVYDAVEQMPVGNTEPKWQGNINTAFNYRGWGLNLSFNYKFGGQIYNETLVNKVENADLRYNADRRVLSLRWQKPGDIVKYKRLTNSNNGSNTKATSRFIMDENTFRMGSLSLSYRMDKTNTPFIRKEKCPLSSIKLSFNMEDLFYLSTVKLERGLDYPFARQFAFSLNVAF